MEEINKGIKIVKDLKHIGYMVKKSMAQQFQDLNITGPQGMLVGILSRNEGMKISDLSKKMGLSNSTVSGIIDRLEKQELVERVRSKEDRRVVYVNLTPEFRKNSMKRFDRVEKNFAEMLQKATPEEMDIIVKGLDTLKKVIDRQEK